MADFWKKYGKIWNFAEIINSRISAEKFFRFLRPISWFLNLGRKNIIAKYCRNCDGNFSAEIIWRNLCIWKELLLFKLHSENFMKISRFRDIWYYHRSYNDFYVFCLKYWKILGCEFCGLFLGWRHDAEKFYNII